MKRILGLALLAFVVSSSLAQDKVKDPLRVLPEGQLPADSRLGKPKDLNAYFPFAPPASKEAWEKRRQDVKEQVLVGNGLWPLPEKTPLGAVIHGKIDRDDYTVEKVFFASYPGHYVTGNLYRPKNKTGKLAGVLCPHGHWANGRFYENGEAGIKKEIASGAEKTPEGAKYPLQARCAHLARMGCVVFHYDMVGYADSQQIKHRAGFTDPEAELRLQNFMGLQTWNSIRALDFLVSLPDVDASRIGVTGASGGGTQTFLLCGIDDRPTVGFPAVMVSTAMQGGCICENCDYLRVGTGNIELAGLFAPKPLAMACANDWTKDMETKGLPELKKLYALYSAEDKVAAKHYAFPHNYNQVSREMMYNWFNKHLKLGQPEPVAEKPFVPVPTKELSVFDDKHPLPRDARSSEELRKYQTETSDKQIAALLPKDEASLKEYRRVIGTALRVMVNDRLPAKDEIEEKEIGIVDLPDGVVCRKLLLGRKGQGEQVPAVALGKKAAKYDGTLVVWVHPAGKASLFQGGKLVAPAAQILDKGAIILAPDVFETGELETVLATVTPDAEKLKSFKLSAKQVADALEQAKVIPASSVRITDLSFRVLANAATEDLAKIIRKAVVKKDDKADVNLGDVATLTFGPPRLVNAGYAGFTFGYNRSVLANRIHDILTAVGYAKNHKDVKTVHLVGLDKAGPWALLARGLCGDAVARTAADWDQFRFEKVASTSDEMMQPGAVKYGGLPALAGLSAPGELFIHNTPEGADRWLAAAYQAAGQAGRLQKQADKAATEMVVKWLLR